MNDDDGHQSHQVAATTDDHNATRKWKRLGLADRVQVVGVVISAAGMVLTVVSLLLVARQLSVNNKTNQVAIRGQLYEREAAMASEEVVDLDQVLSTVWTLVPPTIVGHSYGEALLALITVDAAARQSAHPRTLYGSMFGIDSFGTARRSETADLRRVFLYIQTNLYHVHMAFDYYRDGILTYDEFQTWKNLIREAHAHPILLTAIWQGYENRYFSRSFGRFLQQELCPQNRPEDVRDLEAFRRNSDYVRQFYPEMVATQWPDSLPDY